MASKRELWRTGFRPVPGSNALYIDRCGAVYDYTRQRIVKRKDVARLVLNGQIVNVPQLLLLVFFKQPIKPRRRVQYVDGNRKNLHADNLRYKPDAPDIRIDPAALMTAVRCYHQVPKSYKVNNYTRTRYYLSEIVARRYFMQDRHTTPGISVFATYIDKWLWSKKAVAEQHGITVRQCTEIINPLINQLIADVLQDLERGYLAVQDYRPRKKTTAQVIKEYNEHLRSRGVEPIKILRKKNNKQLLKEWENYREQLRSELQKEGEKSVSDSK